MLRKLSLFGVWLLCWLTVGAGAAEDPLAALRQQAQTYAQALAPKGVAPLASGDLATLGAAARLLTERHLCAQAVELRRLALSGSAPRGSADWYALAQDAQCAKRRDDLVSAAWWSQETASDPKQRRRALLLLGKGLEAHAGYGPGPALEAYRRALALGEDVPLRETVARLERDLREARSLRVERQFTKNDPPALCLGFSHVMPDPERQRYGDYLRFTPALAAEFSKDGPDEICAEGVEFGVTYQVQVLKGLTSVDGAAQLLESDRRELTMGDRPPTLWFENSYYVLPQGGEGVPLHAVNVERARLSLFRIGDRNLLHEFVLGNFRTDLAKWSLQRLRDQLGAQVWGGEVDLTSRANETVLNNLPVARLARPAPGVYVLNAESVAKPGTEETEANPASQWFVVSDLGLSTYRGRDGLTVVVRSLHGGGALAGVRLALYARNNLLLAEQVSDAQGLARFPAALFDGSGGQEALMLLASGPGDDFNFFNLSVSPFDLSDRGVGGRATPGPLDAFLYTERGVYRPGESVNLGVLLRDDVGAAVEGLPLTLRLLRPDEQIALERVIQPRGAGGYTDTLEISPSARTGRWKLQVRVDPKGDPVGEVGFLVDTIIPPRIEVELSEAPGGYLLPPTEGHFTALARYLFGAPAAELAAVGELLIAPDPDPFPAYPGFRFGPVDEADDTVLEPLAKTQTDAAGAARFAFRVERLPNVRRPLRARLRAEVADVDGRPVAAEQWLALRQEALYLGLKGPRESPPEGSDVTFEVLALDRDGQPQARPGLAYRLVEEQVQYQWYHDNGRWLYKRQIRDREVKADTLDLAAAPGRLSLRLGAGQYRLEARDEERGAFSSVRVQVGWSGDLADAETPDMLGLSADRPVYQPGDTARLRLRAPFAGLADLVIATDRVLERREIRLTGEEQVVEVPLRVEWGAGAYALMTAFRPDGEQAGRGPRRAVGVAWLGIAKENHALQVALETVERTRPRGPLAVGVRVSDPQPGTPLYLTLAAVDEGVLQLTDYRTPDPLSFFFGQRQLGVGLRDLYGRLIDGRKGQPAQLRAGSDMAGRQGMPESHVRILSLFSGVVALDGAGRGQVSLNLPDFNGRVRLMAVAWSAARLGSGEAAVTVRDPVVLLPSLPRFLAAGDRSQAALLIQNLDGPAGDYRLSWWAEGSLRLVEPDQASRTLTLAPGQRQALKIPLTAETVGTGSLGVQLDGPADTSLGKRAELGVRAPFLPETRRQLGRLGPGVRVVLGPDLVEGLREETTTGLVSLSGRPDLNVPGLLKQLDLYPYGCLEQVASRAFPLLDFDRLASQWSYVSRVPTRDRLAQAVALVLEKQLENGAFALWDPDGEEETWLSLYVLDFLQRAREAGIPVTEFRWRRGLEWLGRQVEYPQTEDPAGLANQAYALYVLARAGQGRLETTRYLFDEAGEALPGPLVAAHLGAALAILGEGERASRAFGLAQRLTRDEKLRDYGSPLRDRAAVLLLRAESPEGGDVAAQVQELAQQLRQETWLSTQELAWLTRAAAALSGTRAPVQARVDGNLQPPRDTPLVLNPAVEQFKSGIQLANAGQGPIWLGASVTGSPLEAPPPLKAGFHIQRQLFDLQGRPLDPLILPQGTVVVVVLEGRAEGEEQSHQALIVDPLPAGLEVESARLARARSITDLAWLGELTTTLYTEGLDDRFVAALDLTPESPAFRIAYLARAVTPGRYRLPPPEVEDMYKPRYRGRGESGWLNLVPAR